MKHWMVGGLAAMLVAGSLIALAPPASAGCLYGGGVASKCDGAVQPDGTWQRCVTVGGGAVSGSVSQWTPTCQRMGPDQHPLGLAFYDPPTHIDD
jgi:hypothetical protein